MPRFKRINQKSKRLRRARLQHREPVAASVSRRRLTDRRRRAKRPSSTAAAKELPIAPAYEAKRFDPNLGMVYQSRPTHTDDLTALPGIDTEMEAALQQLGIYKREQLMRLSENQFEKLRDQGIRLQAEQVWQAWARAITGRSRPRPPAERLSELTGITKAIEQRLYRLGVTRFFHIARWTPQDIGRIAAQLGLSESPSRLQNWVDQARRRG